VQLRRRWAQSCCAPCVVTPPEAMNTGPGFNRGSGGGARGRGFEERVGAYAHTEGGSFPIAHDLCVCVATIMAVAGLFEV